MNPQSEPGEQSEPYEPAQAKPQGHPAQAKQGDQGEPQAEP